MYKNILLVTFITLLSFPVIADAKSCKKYSSCAEVINDYPSGNFGRKDRDKDGIPCENVCRSLQQVNELLNKKLKSKNEKDKSR